MNDRIVFKKGTNCYVKKRFLIELDNIPKKDEEICLAIEKHCGENSLPFEFLKRTVPIIAMIDGSKFEITKQMQRARVANCWVLHCKEID